jgi:hypothetical protein
MALPAPVVEPIVISKYDQVEPQTAKRDSGADISVSAGAPVSELCRQLVVVAVKNYGLDNLGRTLLVTAGPRRSLLTAPHAGHFRPFFENREFRPSSQLWVCSDILLRAACEQPCRRKLPRSR